MRWRNATMSIDAHWRSSFFLAYNFSCMFPCLPMHVSEESAMKKREDANWRLYFSMLVSFKTCIRHCPSLLIVRTTEKKLHWRNVRMRLDAHCAHWRALKRGTASLFNRPCPCHCYTPGLLAGLLACDDETMTMPMMTLAFRISIRWKYMYQEVERV